MKLRGWPVLLFGIWAGAARADLTIMTEVVVEGQAPMKTTLQFGQGKARIDAGMASTILLPKEGKTIMVMPSNKTYLVMPGLAEMAQKVIAGKREEPEETPRVTRTGKKETISGFACEQVILTKADGSREELWVSREAPEMEGVVEEFGNAMGPLFGEGRAAWRKWNKEHPDLAHFPVRQTGFDAAGKETHRSTVQSFSREPVPASAFEPPADYTEQAMPAFSLPGAQDLDALTEKAEQLDKMAEELKKRLETRPKE